jgi:hypothetical protein
MIKKINGKIIIGLDFDDVVIDTAGRIKQYFSDTYNVKVMDRTTFDFSSMIEGFTDEEISKIIWELDSEKIFNAKAVKFIPGVIEFLEWCTDSKIIVMIQTANIFVNFVAECLMRLPLSALACFDTDIPVIYTAQKYITNCNIVIDDSERFIKQTIQKKPETLAILLTKPHFKYERTYPYMAKDFDEIKQIIVDNL